MYLTKRKARRKKVKVVRPRQTVVRKKLVRTLQELFAYHVTHASATLEDATLKHYFVTQRYIGKFLEERHGLPDIPLNGIDYQFITDFEIFLYQQKPKRNGKPLQTNGILKHMVRLKKLVNLARKLDWIKTEPFRNFKMRRTEVDKGFMHPWELLAVETQLIGSERLSAVRDMFVFSCYTGLAFVDMAALRPEHIVRGVDGELWIHSYRRKTSTPVRTPLLPVAIRIVIQYLKQQADNSHPGIFPLISNQKMNVYLKELALVCGISQPLTYHIARHTFATTVTLANGVPIETVSKMLGHTKLSTTQIYARVLEDKIGRDMKALKEKLSS